MIFGTKNKNILRHVSENNIKIIEIYKKGNKTFQLYCDAVKSDGTIGSNNNYSLNLLTDNGFVQLIDNVQLDIPKINFVRGCDEELQKEYVEVIEEGFNKFKQYADIIAKG